MKTSLPLLIACVAVVLTAGTASADSAQEIFSRANWWQRDGGEVLDTCIDRHRRCV